MLILKIFGKLLFMGYFARFCNRLISDEGPYANYLFRNASELCFYVIRVFKYYPVPQLARVDFWRHKRWTIAKIVAYSALCSVAVAILARKRKMRIAAMSIISLLWIAICFLCCFHWIVEMKHVTDVAQINLDALYYQQGLPLLFIGIGWMVC